MARDLAPSSKGSDTRQRILEQALALASTTGIEGLTLGVLASSLELSKSGLFAHFRSREALQVAVLEVATERFREHVVIPALRAPRGEPRLRALITKWVEWGSAKFQPGGCIFIAAAAELDDRPGPVRDVLVKAQRDWFATISQAARSAVEEKHFRADVDPDQFAFEVYGIALSYHHHSRLMHQPNAFARAQVAFERLVASSRSIAN
ncbi:MAG TPA: TetR/AcrR family transcriptional regulator [Polyangiaceae bacterium]|jgi:AcrR family transcriptional regulator|nr:TetR/AcrR family transcriptional regulator [Polyangiaceae bacterium]